MTTNQKKQLDKVMLEFGMHDDWYIDRVKLIYKERGFLLSELDYFCGDLKKLYNSFATISNLKYPKESVYPTPRFLNYFLGYFCPKNEDGIYVINIEEWDDE